MREDQQLEGRVALVTRAASGNGRAIALRYAREGGAAFFLASEDASWVTGIALPVDGGYTCV